MEFRISDTFTSSLSKLTGDEQKAVKMTAFDLQLDPVNTGMQFHKLDRAKDKHFWSVRVSRDIRIIVHKSDSALLLCYVDHHDAAYHWAERRKIERHPSTGAAQLVEIRETVVEVPITKYVEQPAKVSPKPLLFKAIDSSKLLDYGVPEEWIAAVREVNEDTLFDVASHLPGEAAEALLCLATGETPNTPKPIPTTVNPFDHPDAQRRFRLMADVEELAAALEYPWEKWAVFLHPSQRDLVQRQFNGPAKVSGSAGTGKTVVALHRAVYIAKQNPNARILLTTFNEVLSAALRSKLRQLIGNQPKTLERIEIGSISVVAERIYRNRFGKIEIVDEATQRQLLTSVSQDSSLPFSNSFVWAEWRDIVDAWQLDSWDAYREVQRLGRKTRLREPQREQLWKVFDQVRSELLSRNSMTDASMFARLATSFSHDQPGPYDYVVVDEAQDVGVPELKFLSALATSHADSLFFAGDQGQRIFQLPFSWRSLGIDIRGRSRTLKINYRTSHQIRQQADRLLPPEVSDVDGDTQDRRGTISAFDGPAPIVQEYPNAELEQNAVAEWLTRITADGVKPEEIAILVRTGNQFERATLAITKAGLPFIQRQTISDLQDSKISVMTMHFAKGLEFRAVAVIACDDEVLPLQERIENVTDPGDLEEVYDTERHLLYVACTRARDFLFVTGVSPVSDFLEDFR